jgi:hypothetical protein
MKASRGVLLVALALLAIAALRDLARLGDALPWRQLYDFADFYCAGAALDRGSDPYRYEPLHRCEHAVNETAAYRADPSRVVPAPLPPYDFPPLMLAARLSFANARLIAAVAIAIAVALSIWGLGLVSGRFELAAMALLLPAGFVLLNAGQVVPFALLALVFCGFALSRGLDRVAGILSALTLIEPHLGLPVCAAMICWQPRSRLALGATLAVLAGLSVLLVGFAGAAEYVGRVLPGQALAETSYVYQYSLTYLLRMLGAPTAGALLIGELSYAAVAGFGVWLGRPVAQRLERRELVAYIPGACSVIAGPYVHMVDLSFAIPATLVLATSLRGRWREVAAAALCLLAVPWILVWISKRLFLASLFVVAMLLLRLRVNARPALALFAGVAAGIYLLELAPPAPLVVMTPGTFGAGDLAQEAWRAYVTQLGTASVTWLVVKIPTWLALAAMLASAVAALRPDRIAERP